MSVELMGIATLIIAILGVVIPIVLDKNKVKVKVQREKEYNIRVMDIYERDNTVFLHKLLLLTPSGTTAANPKQVKQIIKDQKIEEDIDQYIKNAERFMSQKGEVLNSDNLWKLRDSVSITESLKKDINILMDREETLLKQIELKKHDNSQTEMDKKYSQDIISSIENLLSRFNGFRDYSN